MGLHKLLRKVSDRFFWPGLPKEVAEYIKGCQNCQQVKHFARPVLPLTSIVSDVPFQRLHIDFVGPFPPSSSGYTYLFTVQDSFTKWAEAFPTKSCTTEVAALLLYREIFRRFGCPRVLVSDQGQAFEAKAFAEFCSLLGIIKNRTCATHPQANGLVERFHRSLLSMLRACCIDNPASWDKVLPACLFAYNSSVHASSGFSPFFLQFGREPCLPLDLVSLRN